MHLLNILILLLTLFKFNECNEIKELKKEMNNLKQDFEYLGQQMLRRVTEFKEEAEKDMEIGLSRLEIDLDRANKNNADLNETINELDKKHTSKTIIKYFKLNYNFKLFSFKF